jgi:hypothetical protein
LRPPFVDHKNPMTAVLDGRVVVPVIAPTGP